MTLSDMYGGQDLAQSDQGIQDFSSPLRWTITLKLISYQLLIHLVCIWLKCNNACCTGAL